MQLSPQDTKQPTGLDLELRGRQVDYDHFVCLEVNHQLSAKMVVQSELNSSTEQFDPIILAMVPITVFPRGMFGNTVIDRDRLSRKLISPSLEPPDLSPYATHTWKGSIRGSMKARFWVQPDWGTTAMVVAVAIGMCS
ncbi:hypothetical protein THAOC_06068 [Thalassiosira oceanica]|uniref:Uncharacterized protein n=1 Tax=Thalassiosira oceanica TaxID=159749 RepID=K0T187_THAOC|nr:hypothetical protein THAOC_06068 [Thalassiosira oceanica]|eukprot:EJK72403.1 hypothetical protein THAOC_06068 [Thalassiosira oceanica]